MGSFLDSILLKDMDSFEKNLSERKGETGKEWSEYKNGGNNLFKYNYYFRYLELLVSVGDINLMRAWLDKNSDEDNYIKMSTVNGALCKAAEEGKLDLIELILKYTVKHQVSENPWPLIFACVKNNMDVIKTLLDFGFPVSGTSLSLAVHSNNYEMLGMLLDKCRNVDIYDGLALLIACKMGNAELVKIMLDSGASKEVSSEGKTPLHYALLSGSTGTAQILLDSGANINANSCSILNDLCSEGKVDMVDFALKKGAFAEWGHVKTAIEHKHVPVLNTLFKHGVKIRQYEEEILKALNEYPDENTRSVVLERLKEEYLEDKFRTKLISTDEFGELYEVYGSKEVFNIVKVKNATKEKDGTNKTHLLTVPAEITTPKEAVAWTFGLGKEEYSPIKET